MNWNQTGMPTALVGRPGQRRAIAEFKAALYDAQNHVMRPVDVELLAQELAQSGGREFVELVKGLTTALANAKRELEEANRRCERLAADLARRGGGIAEGGRLPQDANRLPEQAESGSAGGSKSSEDGQAEWEEWNRRFQALLG